MAITRSLEARYRRLLTWFPLEHRREHGDEMAGVLLAASEPGRTRPGRAESLDLMLGGLRVRLRPGGALADGDGWRDALAVFSVVMPLLVLAGTCATVLNDQIQIGWSGEPLGIVINLINGQLLLVPLVLLALRRSAVVAAVIPLALTAYIVSAGLSFGWLDGLIGPTYVWNGSYGVVAGVLELVALLASPGPRRGLQLLRGRRWAYVAVAVVPAIVVVGGPNGLLQYAVRSNANVVGPLVAISATAVIALGAAWLTSALGKRLAVLFAALACAYVAPATLYLPVPTQATFISEVLTALSEIAAAGVAVVVVRRVRHRARP